MILVLGATGQLGTALMRLENISATPVTRAELDITDLDAIGPFITTHRPKAVINCAAYNAVDRAEVEEDQARLADLVNGFAVERLAAVCAEIGARFVTFSSDYVFDGTNTQPYVESDPVRPINRYGESKELGERLASQTNPEMLLVRTSWVHSGTHPNFAATMIRIGREGGAKVVDDQVGSPTLVADLAPAVVAAVEGGVTGILHLTNQGAVSWYELAREVLGYAGLDPEVIQPCTTADYPQPAARPAYSVMESELDTDIVLPPYGPSMQRAVRSLSR